MQSFVQNDGLIFLKEVLKPNFHVICNYYNSLLNVTCLLTTSPIP